MDSTSQAAQRCSWHIRSVGSGSGTVATLASSSFTSCLTSGLTRRSGGGRAGDDVNSLSCRSTAGRCLTEVDFTAVGPVLSIGPSSESEFSDVPGSCRSGAGD